MMRLTCLIAALAVSGCGRSAAQTADSSNPAHCLASYNYAAFWLNKGMDGKSLHHALSSEAAYYFTAAKLKREGSLTQAEAEARQATIAFGKQDKVMDQIYRECREALERNDEFMKNEIFWMRTARAKSARCQQDIECRISK